MSMATNVIWFSCGACSAVAASLADGDIYYCDPGGEHPDNKRFLQDVQAYLGRPIHILRSPDFKNPWEVFSKHRYLSGVKGARCTVELKKKVAYQVLEPGDVETFGFSLEERGRVARFEANNPDRILHTPLIDAGLSKANCLAIVEGWGVELPVMYRLGFRNNNCIGCVKGQAGYWNHIRKHFPETFHRMAKLEREIGAAICKTEAGGKRVPVYLDELNPGDGRYEGIEPECDLFCI